MRFSDLTWNTDSLGMDGVTNMGWQSQYEADNGCLLVVDTNIEGANTEGIETPLATANEPGQRYRCTILSWDNRTLISIEEDCTNNRVDSIISEVEALQGETFVETTTTTTIRPSTTWD